MIGGVLVERNVKEVVPAVEKNGEQVIPFLTNYETKIYRIIDYENVQHR